MDSSQRITQSSSLEANQQPSEAGEQSSNAKPLTSQTLGMIRCWNWAENDSLSRYDAPRSTPPLPQSPFFTTDASQSSSQVASLESTQPQPETPEQGNSAPIQMARARGWNLTEFDSLSLYETDGPTPPLSYSAPTSTEASLIATPHFSWGERFTQQTHYTFNPDELSAAVSRKSTGSTMSIDSPQHGDRTSPNAFTQSPAQAVVALPSYVPQYVAEPPTLAFTHTALSPEAAGMVEFSLFTPDEDMKYFEFTSTAECEPFIEGMFVQTALPAHEAVLPPQDEAIGDAKASSFYDFVEELGLHSAQ